jgi:hypothetical protein
MIEKPTLAHAKARKDVVILLKMNQMILRMNETALIYAPRALHHVDAAFVLKQVNALFHAPDLATDMRM